MTLEEKSIFPMQKDEGADRIEGVKPTRSPVQCKIFFALGHPLELPEYWYGRLGGHPLT